MTQGVFKSVDVDGTGSFNLYELRSALQALGFRLNSRLFTAIAIRFGDEEGRISFNDFLQCIARLRKCFGKFLSRISLKDFLQFGARLSKCFIKISSGISFNDFLAVQVKGRSVTIYTFFSPCLPARDSSFGL